MSNERERLSEVYGELLNDDTARRWSTKNAGNARILRERVAETSRVIASRSIRPRPLVLDLGSGGHTTLCPTLDDPATTRRVGLDILLERLAQASSTDAEHTLVCADGQQLPFVDELFDIVTIFTVFSSILDQGVQARIATEVERVLRPGGFVLWYDMRYRNPREPRHPTAGTASDRTSLPEPRRASAVAHARPSPRQTSDSDVGTPVLRGRSLASHAQPSVRNPHQAE